MEEEHEDPPLSVEVSCTSNKDTFIDDSILVSSSSEDFTSIITVDVKRAWKVTAAHAHSQLGPCLSYELF